MQTDKITIEEFIEEVWNVEHIRIDINFHDGATHLVDHYPYTEPCDDDMTVDEFKEQRINPILNRAIGPEFIFTTMI